MPLEVLVDDLRRERHCEPRKRTTHCARSSSSISLSSSSPSSSPPSSASIALSDDAVVSATSLSPPSAVSASSMSMLESEGGETSWSRRHRRSIAGSPVLKTLVAPKAADESIRAELLPSAPAHSSDQKLRRQQRTGTCLDARDKGPTQSLEPTANALGASRSSIEIRRRQSVQQAHRSADERSHAGPRLAGESARNARVRRSAAARQAWRVAGRQCASELVPKDARAADRAAAAQP